MIERRLAALLLACACLALGSCGGGSGGLFAGVGSGGTGGGGGGGGGSGGGSGGGGGPGSGGTGISLASVFVGSIDGFGSIIVNGVRHDIASASVSIEDAAELQLGMTTRVLGTVADSLSTGTATQVVSAADLRGTASAINSGSGTFELMGARVSTDDATVYAGVAGFASLAPGDMLQVHGLPAGPGALRATRVQKLPAAAAPIATGMVENLQPGSSTFVLGSLTVQFASATFSDGLSAATLANGQLVRVRATADPVAGVLAAARVQPWYSTAAEDGAPLSLAGVVTDYASLGAFRLLGVPVDGSTAQITGGPAGSIGNGVKLEVSGTLSQGTLVASRIRIRYVPGTGGPSSFDLIGAVGAYVSAADFRVQGQPVDASGGTVVFSGGTAADLRNGVRVDVRGSKVVNGVLVADSVTFQ